MWVFPGISRYFQVFPGKETVDLFWLCLVSLHFSKIHKDHGQLWKTPECAHRMWHCLAQELKWCLLGDIDFRIEMVWMMIFTGWWCQASEKHESQLGWWTSQLNGNIKKECFKQPTKLISMTKSNCPRLHLQSWSQVLVSHVVRHYQIDPKLSHFGEQPTTWPHSELGSFSLPEHWNHPSVSSSQLGCKTNQRFSCWWLYKDK